MRKIRLTVKVIFYLIIILTFFMILLLSYRDESNANIYVINWGIITPLNLKKEYHNQDKHDFQGKGIRYTIFSTKDNITIPLNCSTKNKKNVQSYNGSSEKISSETKDYVKSIIKELDIPVSYQPMYNQCYEWQILKYNRHTLIILYFPNVNNVFFIEKLV